MCRNTYAAESGLGAGPDRPDERPFADYLAEGRAALTPTQRAHCNEHRQNEMATRYALIARALDRSQPKVARRIDLRRAA